MTNVLKQVHQFSWAIGTLKFPRITYKVVKTLFVQNSILIVGDFVAIKIVMHIMGTTYRRIQPVICGACFVILQTVEGICTYSGEDGKITHLLKQTINLILILLVIIPSSL